MNFCCYAECKLICFTDYVAIKPNILVSTMHLSELKRQNYDKYDQFLHTHEQWQLCCDNYSSSSSFKM